MKITHMTLSIPPYLSTTWDHIRALYLKEKTLIVSLVDGVVIEIPNLSEEDLKAIFSAHASYAELQTKKTAPPLSGEKQTPFHLFHGNQNVNENVSMLRFNLDNMEGLSNAFQHNSSQSNLPNFPSEILEKIASIAKIVAPLEIENMPKAEPHCNCPHCQIARAIHGNHVESEEVLASAISQEAKETVANEDLEFQAWTITQTGENLFSVVNKLDPLEKYNVFLGNPVGCTCGKEGCEHIIAVLKS